MMPQFAKNYTRNLALRGEWAFVPGRPFGRFHLAFVDGAAGLGLFPGSAGAGLGLWVGLGQPDQLGLAWRTFCAPAAGHTSPPGALGGAFFGGRMAPGVGGGRAWKPFYMPPWCCWFSGCWRAVPRQRFGVGLACGAAVWVRPDGLTLLGPLVFVLALENGDWKTRPASVLRAVGGFLVVFLPYLVFNRVLGGTWWPKYVLCQAGKNVRCATESHFWCASGSRRRCPGWVRGSPCCPVFLIACGWGLRRRCWVALAGAIWWLGYTGIYAAGLPVAYQAQSAV